LPLTTVTLIGTGVLVRLKVAVLVVPLVEAVTVNEPAVEFAVHGEELAWPLELVVSVSVPVVLGKVQVAPFAAGFTVNVTDAPLDGDPFEVTVACRAAKAVPTSTL